MLPIFAAWIFKRNQGPIFSSGHSDQFLKKHGARSAGFFYKLAHLEFELNFFLPCDQQKLLNVLAKQKILTTLREWRLNIPVTVVRFRNSTVILLPSIFCNKQTNVFILLLRSKFIFFAVSSLSASAVTKVSKFEAVTKCACTYLNSHLRAKS